MNAEVSQSRSSHRLLLFAGAIALMTPLAAVIFWRLTPAEWPDWVFLLVLGALTCVALARRQTHVAIELALGAGATVAVLAFLYTGMAGLSLM
jgi:hypothetical protein